MKRLVNLIAVSVVVLFMGCVYQEQVYNPANLPDTEMAKLYSSYNKSEKIDTQIRSVKDMVGNIIFREENSWTNFSWDLSFEQATLMPGKYQLVVRCNHKNVMAYPHMTVQLEPATHYVLVCYQENDDGEGFRHSWDNDYGTARVTMMTVDEFERNNLGKIKGADR